MHLFSKPQAVPCPLCHRWFKPGNEMCAVLHEGNGCCHHGDTEIPAPDTVLATVTVTIGLPADESLFPLNTESLRGAFLRWIAEQGLHPRWTEGHVSGICMPVWQTWQEPELAEAHVSVAPDTKDFAEKVAADIARATE